MGIGDFLSGLLGTNTSYQGSAQAAGNPYDMGILQDEVHNQYNLYNQQQGLSSVLSQQMQGQGPNPAQTQFLQNQANNNMQTAGLMASNRGLNPGLAAKIAANASAMGNNQANAQSAILQQNQQIAAAQNLGNLYGQMQQGNLGYQGLYGQQNLGASQLNEQAAAGNQQASEGIIGGIFNGIGSGLQTALGGGKALPVAHGGLIPKGYASGQMVGPEYDSQDQDVGDGGPSVSGGGSKYQISFPPMGLTAGNSAQMPQMPQPLAQVNQAINDGQATDFTKMSKPASKGPMSNLGRYLNNSAPISGPGAMAQGLGNFGAGIGTALKGSGSSDGTPSKATDFTDIAKARGGKIPKNFKPGGRVPGKANVHGDSTKNDTVPAWLSPGEVVLPRSVVNSKKPLQDGQKFLAAVLAKHGKKA